MRRRDESARAPGKGAPRRWSGTDEPDPRSWLQEATSFTAIGETPLTFEVVLASRAITLPHQDPADRFIAASARHTVMHVPGEDDPAVERWLAGD